MRRLFLMLFSLLAISACSDDVDYNPEGEVEESRVDDAESSSDFIKFSVETTSLTKAEIVEEVSDMDSFSLFAYRTADGSDGMPDAYGTSYCTEIMYNAMYEYSEDDEVWKDSDTSASDVTWDYTSVADRFSFFAISPYADANAANTVYDTGIEVDNTGAKLRYTLPEAIGNQTDLMIAHRMNILRPQAGIVALDFSHALAAIQITVMGRDDVGSITLKGYANIGTLDLMTGEWSEISTTTENGAVIEQVISGTSIDNSEADDIADMVTKTTDEGYILMIPQVVVEATEHFVSEEYGYVTTYASPESADFVIVITADGTRDVASDYDKYYEVEVSLGESVDSELTLEGGKLYNFVYRSATLNGGVIDLSNYDSAVSSLDEAKALLEGLISELSAYSDEISTITLTGTYNKFLIQALADAEFITELDLSEVIYDDAYYFNDDGSIAGNINKKIHNNVLQGNETIELVVLPEELDEINGSAFSGCTNLERVIFDEVTYVTILSTYTFSSCTSLEYLYLPDSITSLLSYVFEDCSNLKVLSLPGITEMGDSGTSGSGVLDDCSDLETLFLATDGALESLKYNFFSSSNSGTTTAFSGCTLYTSYLNENADTNDAGIYVTTTTNKGNTTYTLIIPYTNSNNNSSTATITFEEIIFVGEGGLVYAKDQDDYPENTELYGDPVDPWIVVGYYDTADKYQSIAGPYYSN